MWYEAIAIDAAVELAIFKKQIYKTIRADSKLKRLDVDVEQPKAIAIVGLHELTAGRLVTALRIAYKDAFVILINKNRVRPGPVSPRAPRRHYIEVDHFAKHDVVTTVRTD